jgi:hypothetical protein
MQVICAWCQKDLGYKPDDEETANFEITHGICDSCSAYFFSDQPHTLDSFLNQLPAPILMVNGEGTVVSANDQLLQFLGKDMAAVRGLKGGDVMECVYARLPEGCGNTRHCVACTIRNNVMATFETGQSLKRVPAFLNRVDRQSVHKMEFLISTEKVGETVLLRIDEVLG